MAGVARLRGRLPQAKPRTTRDVPTSFRGVGCGQKDQEKPGCWRPLPSRALPALATPPRPRLRGAGCPAGLSWNLQKGRFKEERKRQWVVSQITRPQRKETPGWFCLRGTSAARVLRVPVTCVSSLRAVSSLQRWPQLSQSYFATDLREARQVARRHQRISCRDGTLRGVSGWQVGASTWALLCTAAQLESSPLRGVSATGSAEKVGWREGVSPALLVPLNEPGTRMEEVTGRLQA